MKQKQAEGIDEEAIDWPRGFACRQEFTVWFLIKGASVMH